MANMSYCRFQNTYNDLIDCSVNLFDEDMSDNEKMARKSLIELCKEIVEHFEFNNFGELEDDLDVWDKQAWPPTQLMLYLDIIRKRYEYKKTIYGRVNINSRR